MCGFCVKCTAGLVHELDRELLHAQEDIRALNERIRELEAAAEVAVVPEAMPTVVPTEGAAPSPLMEGSEASTSEKRASDEYVPLKRRRQDDRRAVLSITFTFREAVDFPDLLAVEDVERAFVFAEKTESVMKVRVLVAFGKRKRMTPSEFVALIGLRGSKFFAHGSSASFRQTEARWIARCISIKRHHQDADLLCCSSADCINFSVEPLSCFKNWFDSHW